MYSQSDIDKIKELILNQVSNADILIKENR